MVEIGTFVLNLLWFAKGGKRYVCSEVTQVSNSKRRVDFAQICSEVNMSMQAGYKYETK